MCLHNFQKLFLDSIIISGIFHKVLCLQIIRQISFIWILCCELLNAIQNGKYRICGGPGGGISTFSYRTVWNMYFQCWFFQIRSDPSFKLVFFSGRLYQYNFRTFNGVFIWIIRCSTKSTFITDLVGNWFPDSCIASVSAVSCRNLYSGRSCF